MRSVLFLLGIISLLISCKQENSELTGHWVSTKYFEGKDFTTIDFKKINDESYYTGEDTVRYYITFNKNSLSTGYDDHWLAKLDSGYVFCSPHCDAFSWVFFRNDSLFIHDERYSEYDSVYVKIDDQKSFYDELFNRTGIIARLPVSNAGDSILNLKRTLVANLNIGKGKFDPVNSDSIKINVWDAYLPLVEVPKFVSRQKDALPETDRLNLKIVINADSSVSKEFLNQVVSQINKVDSTLKIYQSTFDYKTNKLYCYPLQ